MRLANLTDNPGQKKILTKRGSKYPENICSSSKVTVNIMMCGNAAGDLIPPYVVYKTKNLWQLWTENTMPLHLEGLIQIHL